MVSAKRWLLPAALLLLGAYALRLYRLDAQSIWWDEGISMHLATSSAAEIVADRLDNIHPPLYFFLLKGWLALTGVSPITGRYLSVMAGLLQVALVFAAVRTWRKSLPPSLAPGEHGRALLPWLAAGLMALSPLSVIYSQEIRVYALLPVVYFVLLILAHLFLTAREQGSRGAGVTRSPLPPRSPAPLLLLAAAEWLALHLHYIALFAVAYVALWGAWALARRRDWAGLRRWLVAQAVVALASLPWFLAVVANRAAVQAEANAGTFTTEAVPLGFLLAQVWGFHLTGLAGALGNLSVRLVAAAAAILGGALLLIIGSSAISRGAPPRRATVTLHLAAHWAVPLLAALLLWNVRSFSHPRYVIMFAALFIPLAAFLMLPAPTRPRRVLAGLFGACLLLLSLWGLRQYFFDPAVAKPDMRGVAHYLEASAAPGDLILIPDTDWSLPFEYAGPAAVLMPQVDESPHDAGAALNRALDCAGGPPCAESGRVFVVDYDRGTRDWQGRLPFELARRGYRVGAANFGDLSVAEYRLTAHPGPLPACDAPEMARPAAHFGPLALEAAWIQSDAPADGAVAVALCWRLADAAAADYVASLLLRDPFTGERLAQSDTRLLNRDGAPATQWLPGEIVVTYHVLPLPAGTPPLEFSLLTGVYTEEAGQINHVEAQDAAGAPLGQLLPLGEVTLSEPALATAIVPAGDTLAAFDDLRLLEAQLPPGSFRPGQIVRVRLTWQAAGELDDILPTLALEQDGVIVVSDTIGPAQDRFPTDQWAAGQVVAEVRDLRLPGEATGTASLVLSVADERFELGEITIEGATAQFEPPTAAVPTGASFGDAIALTGFDSPAVPLDATQPVPVTLYWQALSGEIPQSYTVFVQLLADDGRLIAQSDAIPAGGTRPTNEWLAGEYVTDAHTLAWREAGYSGPARLIVGLYDPLTGERLLTAEGMDHFDLPISLSVGSQP